MTIKIPKDIEEEFKNFLDLGRAMVIAQNPGGKFNDKELKCLELVKKITKMNTTWILHK